MTSDDDDEHLFPKPRGKLTCRGCSWPILTWRESSRSYRRMVTNGITPEEAKTLGPLCGDCVSRVLRERFGHAGYKNISRRGRYA
jgi:hypothetical protein